MEQQLLTAKQDELVGVIIGVVVGLMVLPLLLCVIKTIIEFYGSR